MNEPYIHIDFGNNSPFSVRVNDGNGITNVLYNGHSKTECRLFIQAYQKGQEDFKDAFTKQGLIDFGYWLLDNQGYDGTPIEEHVHNYLNNIRP